MFNNKEQNIITYLTSSFYSLVKPNHLLICVSSSA